MRKLSVVSVLFSGTQEKLLAALFLNSHQPVYATELANHLGVRPSTLQRDLARFTAVGILKTWRSGNRVYFQANEQCPVFPELRSLFIKTSGLADVLSRELAPVAFKIKVAAVYGSIASGTDFSGSDIDLLIIGSVKMIELIVILEASTRTLGRQINPSLYTAEEFTQKARRSHFVRSLLVKPLLFVLGTKSDLETIAGRKPRGGGANESQRN